MSAKKLRILHNLLFYFSMKERGRGGGGNKRDGVFESYN